jgi:hypothetical protein
VSELLTLPLFKSRAEGDGFVVHLVGSANYLFADPVAHDVLSRLRAGDEPARVAEEVAHRAGLTEQAALAAVIAVAEVLRGERRAAEPGEGHGPRLIPLTDLVGPAADRCETFGMPL